MNKVQLGIAIATVAAVLLACSDGSSPRPDAAARRAARIKSAIEAALQPARQTVHHLAAGDLLVLDVPILTSPSSADVQKCFVWRDLEFKTASLQCPAEVSGPLPSTGGPTPDSINP